MARRLVYAAAVTVGALAAALGSTTLPAAEPAGGAASTPARRPTTGPTPAGQPQAQSPAQSPAQSRVLQQGDLRPALNEGAFKKPKLDRPTRDGQLTRGQINIAAVWFSGQTTRYRHTPFGNEPHPDVLTVSTAERRVLRLQLPVDSVFEDRVPRLFDIDGDGRDEIIVVRSYLKQGAALAVVRVGVGEVSIMAETPPLGLPFQWLNPAGFGDFDGDGKPDMALVATPHVAGELQFWTLRDGALVQIGATDDVSNHVFGSKHLALSAVADFNGDGIPDIAIPNQNRYRLRFFTLAGGKLQDLGEAELRSPAAEDFAVVKVGDSAAVRVGFAGGRSVTIAPCRDISDWEMVKGGC